MTDLVQQLAMPSSYAHALSIFNGAPDVPPPANNII